MDSDLREIGLRIQGLRDACDVTEQEMADELKVSLETYRTWEQTGADVPISAIFHMAHKFGVDFNEIRTAAKLDTYHVVRRGQGKEVDRYPGYSYDDLAWRYQNKIMQPLLVVLDPSDEPAKLVTHEGQEFNFVLEGSLTLTFGTQEIVLNQWDSIYFNPQYPHGQRCHGDAPCKFITIIAE